MNWGGVGILLPPIVLRTITGKLANQKQALSQVAHSTCYAFSLRFWSDIRQKYKPSKDIKKYIVYILWIYILMYLITIELEHFIL